MIIHLFNCGRVSGPEVLVVGNLSGATPASSASSSPPDSSQFMIVNLEEARHPDSSYSLRDYCQRKRLNYYGISVRRRWDAEAERGLAELLVRLAPALVHSHDVKASFYLSRMKNRRFRTVSTHHGVEGRPDLKSRVYEWFYRFWILPQFDAVCAVSQQDFEVLARVPGLKEKLHFHLNGMTVQKWGNPERAEARAQLRKQWKVSGSALSSAPSSATSQPLCLGMVGRLSAEKNQLAALEALRMLQGEVSLQLLFFGAGADEGALKRTADELGLAPWVKWMGYSANMESLYPGFDAVLLLSKAEGLPMALLEAGWAGVPVVSTAVGGVPDLLEGGQCGWLLPTTGAVAENLAICLRKLARNPEQLEEMGSRFQARVERLYSRGAWLARLRTIYGQLGVACL